MNKFILLATAFVVLSPSLSYGMEEDSTNHIAGRTGGLVLKYENLQLLPIEILNDIFTNKVKGFTKKGRSFEQTGWAPRDAHYCRQPEKFMADLRDVAATTTLYYNYEPNLTPNRGSLNLIVLEIVHPNRARLTMIDLIGTQ